MSNGDGIAVKWLLQKQNRDVIGKIEILQRKYRDAIEAKRRRYRGKTQTLQRKTDTIKAKWKHYSYKKDTLQILNRGAIYAVCVAYTINGHVSDLKL